METRPSIKITPSGIDRLFEITGWLLILSTWTFIILVYPTLPETVPTHFNASGRADGYGSKTTLYLLPVISTFIFAGMTILNRYPHLFNYPTVVTAENAFRFYSTATRVIRYLKMVVVIIFSAITFLTYRTTQGNAGGLGKWFLPVTILLLVFPGIYLVIKALTRGKQENH